METSEFILWVIVVISFFATPCSMILMTSPYLENILPKRKAARNIAEIKLNQYKSKVEALQQEGYSQEGIKKILRSERNLLLSNDVEISQKTDLKIWLEQLGFKDVSISDISLHEELIFRWKEYYFDIFHQALYFILIDEQEPKILKPGSYVKKFSESTEFRKNYSSNKYLLTFRYDGESIWYENVSIQETFTKNTPLIIYSSPVTSCGKIWDDLKKIDNKIYAIENSVFTYFRNFPF